MSLFQWGKFRLHSGGESPFKIDCDALTMDDLAAISWLLLPRLRSFAQVVSIPTGGDRLAAFFRPWETGNPDDGWLLVDDVYTTGASMAKAKADHVDPKQNFQGVVIFARAPTPSYVTAAFSMVQTGYA